MPNNYRFSDGHVYYPDAPWALSSISQLAFWRERIEPVGKYIGQNSFDIGNWYKPRFAKDDQPRAHRLELDAAGIGGQDL